MTKPRKYQTTTKYPDGVPEDTTHCIAIVVDGYAVGERQCLKKRGHGKDGLFCAVHAKTNKPKSNLDIPFTNVEDLAWMMNGNLELASEVFFGRKTMADAELEEFELFQRQVKESRPDLDFTFENLSTPGTPNNFHARWTFPGARTGGEMSGGHVGWLHGTRELCWGIEYKDIDAWIVFEQNNGRKPRFT